MDNTESKEVTTIESPKEAVTLDKEKTVTKSQKETVTESKEELAIKADDSCEHYSFLDTIKEYDSYDIKNYESYPSSSPDYHRECRKMCTCTIL